jgi:hypothetical protein
VKHIWTDPTSARPTSPVANKRATERRPAALPGRLTWKDQRGTTRFATVVTRDVSELGVYVECHSVVSIPMFRLVQFQLEREVLDSDEVPAALRRGRCYRRSTVFAPDSWRRGGALRLMVDRSDRCMSRTAQRMGWPSSWVPWAP